jgi:hypothetical protein
MVFVLAGGCASTPQAPSERDAEAKRFVVHPGTAAIYVYRPDFPSNPDDSVLYLDGRLIGATLPGGYFRIDAQPGRHVLQGLAYDTGQLTLEVRPGEIYFVSLTVLGGRSHFDPKPAAVGRRELLDCCVLFENWAPGQRPLIR